VKYIIDIEANSLTRPSKIWCIVCKNIDNGQRLVFRNLCDDEKAKEDFRSLVTPESLWIGHNILGYDIPVIQSLLGITLVNCLDTLVLSKLVNYSRPDGHSLESYGQEFGLEKIKFNDFTKWSQELEKYCEQDVEICHLVYNSFSDCVSDPLWQSAIQLEHNFQREVVNSLHDNGFGFDSARANRLLSKVEQELKELDEKIVEAFPPKEVLIREFTPKLTKFGTISRTSVPRSLHPQMHLYVAGETYKHTRLEPFNPSSHKQIVSILNEAGWHPIDKTQTHIDTEREANLLQRHKEARGKLTLEDTLAKLEILKKTGWKVNETNLSTLPETAPAPARLLAKRILLEARRRTLVEWLSLVQDDGRIHGKFYGIGAWTHRMAHQQPNTANIPREFKEDGSVKLLGKELRQLWIAPKKKLLVGVDAEGIQLRVFAHYIDDPEFTKSLVEGRKDDKTDPHSLNQRILGPLCKSRQAAKRFIFALLLGAGIWKLSQILGTSESETREALDRLLQRYEGFRRLKETVIPKDARRGYFIGLDGRQVRLPGDTVGERQHLAMSGYLQNGEAIIIKRAALKSSRTIKSIPGLSSWMFVNIVHDELQSEVDNDQRIALQVAQIKADAIKEAGEFYKLKCPMAGSYWNEDNKDYTIGTNWYQTH